MNKKAPYRIGLIGGGQLARMMILENSKYGFLFSVYSEKKDDPAAQVSLYWHKGQPSQIKNDKKNFKAWLKTVDYVTFESEFVDTDFLLKHLTLSEQKKINPSLKIIKTLQDRKTQKKALMNFKIPTSPFKTLNSKYDLLSFFKSHPKGCVIKLRRHGYDGYGTWIISNQKDLNSFIKDFSHKIDLKEFIVEKKISFKRELALTAFRDKAGYILWAPLVEWKARDKKCWWVAGPMIETQTKKKIFKLKIRLENFLNKLKYVGAFSFELFDDGHNIYVNEVAPRVHNSCHYSIEALAFNQFQLHVLAVSGFLFKNLSLKNNLIPLNTKAFAMVNLIGREAQSPHQIFPSTSIKVLTGPSLEKLGSFHLHWYAKNEERQGRKMGHVTVIDKTSKVALQRALKIEKTLWLKKV